MQTVSWLSGFFFHDKGAFVMLWLAGLYFRMTVLAAPALLGGALGPTTLFGVTFLMGIAVISLLASRLRVERAEIQ